MVARGRPGSGAAGVLGRSAPLGAVSSTGLALMLGTTRTAAGHGALAPTRRPGVQCEDSSVALGRVVLAQDAPRHDCHVKARLARRALGQPPPSLTAWRWYAAARRRSAPSRWWACPGTGEDRRCGRCRPAGRGRRACDPLRTAPGAAPHQIKCSFRLVAGSAATAYREGPLTVGRGRGCGIPTTRTWLP